MSNITTQYSFALPDKTYTSIFTLLSDLNAAIIINVQPKLQINEIAPFFSLNLTELNKINMTFVTNSSTFSFINNGLLFYYLGYNINNVKLLLHLFYCKKQQFSVFKMCIIYLLIHITI